MTGCVQAPWRGLSKRVLLISGVHPPPDDPHELLFYDVLVHETQWYFPQVQTLMWVCRCVHVCVNVWV